MFTLPARRHRKCSRIVFVTEVDQVAPGAEVEAKSKPGSINPQQVFHGRKREGRW